MTELGPDDILQILPHRPPMLLVDRITELTHESHAVGWRTVTDDDCEGHFPGHPIFPGVKIAEALAQTAAIAFLAESEKKGRPVYLVGFDKLRFRKPVVPGDLLRLEVHAQSNRRGLVTFSVEARVDGQRVANGSLMATAPDQE